MAETATIQSIYLYDASGLLQVYLLIQTFLITKRRFPEQFDVISIVVRAILFNKCNETTKLDAVFLKIQFFLHNFRNYIEISPKFTYIYPSFCGINGKSGGKISNFANLLLFRLERKKRCGIICYEATPSRLISLVIGLYFLIGFIMGPAEAVVAMAAEGEAVLLLLVVAEAALVVLLL
jgi:hypothetical protein